MSFHTRFKLWRIHNSSFSLDRCPLKRQKNEFTVTMYCMYYTLIFDICIAQTSSSISKHKHLYIVKLLCTPLRRFTFIPKYITRMITSPSVDNLREPEYNDWTIRVKKYTNNLISKQTKYIFLSSQVRHFRYITLLSQNTPVTYSQSKKKKRK